MKRTATVLLKALIILVGIAVLAFLLVEPHFEDRNAHATFFQVYFKDPFLAYVYLASILFFVSLYQAFLLLGYIDHDQLFSLRSLRALRTIKYCAAALAASILAAMIPMILLLRGTEDIAGGIAMGLFAISVSIVIAIAGAVCEKFVRRTLKETSGQVWS